MTRTEVIDQLGQPQKQEAKGATELLFYRTIWQVADQAKLRTPIAIRDGVVVGFGDAYLAKPCRITRGIAWDAWLVDVRADSNSAALLAHAARVHVEVGFLLLEPRRVLAGGDVAVRARACGGARRR